MTDGVLFERALPDGRLAHVIPLTYGRARLCVVLDRWTYGAVY